MHKTEGLVRSDILIVGGGLAGAAAAAVLGRTGLDVSLVDRHAVYPPDFRAEQLVGDQTDMLRRLGLLDGIVGNIRPLPNAAAACYGKTLETTDSPHYGLRYDGIVNAARSMASRATFLTGRVARIEAGQDAQRVHLADGRTLEARLAVLATGPNCDDLLASAGIRRKMLSANHSLAFGFDVSASFRSIVAYQGEQAGDGMDYLVFFPIGDTMRANLFCYRDPRDAWVKSFKEDPERALMDVMPGLEPSIGPFTVIGKVQVRPNSILRAENAQDCDGIVLIGDAYQSPCPSVGFGVGRALTDVEALSRLVPAWLSSPGMGTDKISQFYQDPAKRAMDVKALRDAMYRHALCTETSFAWRAHRARVYYTRRGKRVLRQAIRREAPQLDDRFLETTVG